LFDNGFFKRGASKFYLFTLVGHRIKKLERSDDFSVCVHKLTSCNKTKKILLIVVFLVFWVAVKPVFYPSKNRSNP
jgi:hypothetical protein